MSPRRRCPAGHPGPRGPRLVRREAELGLLAEELGRVRQSGLGCVLLTGEPGVGKTRLAAEFLDRQGGSVIGLSARAYPLGGTASFGPWVEALEGHLRGLPAAEVNDLCGGYLDDLASLLRTVAAVRGSAPSGEPPRLRILEGLSALVDALAASSPVVVLLDDVHLADASSLEALHYLARTVAGAPVLVVMTARRSGLAVNRLAGDVLLSLDQDGLLRRADLAPLDPQAVATLAEMVLGEAPPAPLVTWLVDRSRGNPLFALGLLQALVDRGADLSEPALRSVPQGLADQVRSRLHRLEGAALATLEVLALVGQRVELNEFARLSGRPLDRLGDILEALVDSRLVQEERRGRELMYEIAHPLVAEAIYEGIGGARQRSLHRLVGRALMGLGRLGQAAPHFARSAEVGDPEAIDALREAVRQAEEREASREAMAILGALAEVLPPGDERWLAVFESMARRAEWVLDHRVDGDVVLGIRAMREIDAALGRMGDPSRWAAAKLRMASFLTYGPGDVGEAERLAREAVTLYQQAGDASGARLAANELAWIIGAQGRFEAMEDGGRTVVGEAEAVGDRLAVILALGTVGFAATYRGRFTIMEECFRRSAAIGQECGRTFRVSFDLGGLAGGLALSGRLPEALEVLEEGKRSNPAWRDTALLWWSIFISWLAGDFEEAVSVAQDVILADPGTQSRRRSIGPVWATLAAAELDRLDEGEAMLRKARAAYGDRHWFLMRCACSWAEAAILRGREHLAEAVAALRWAADHALGKSGWTWAGLYLVDLAEVAAEAGEIEAAIQAATDLDNLATQTESALHPALATLAAASAHRVAGRPDAAAESAGQAVDALSGLGYQALLGRAHDALGRGLAGSDRDRAVAALQEAEELFGACGATWRRDRALEMLAGLGTRGRRAAAARRGADALTRREREVAALAARGRSAREIAEQLFIGERTVEFHLANSYSKLGVGSKVELVRRATELGL